MTPGHFVDVRCFPGAPGIVSREVEESTDRGNTGRRDSISHALCSIMSSFTTASSCILRIIILLIHGYYKECYSDQKVDKTTWASKFRDKTSILQLRVVLRY
ncbi:hypothetical protein O3P69_005886 [Scylla paramamosain]|uniref:Uncharacterized protein n=1 Tax=Scylla paramamosain TaxID=85552 RepID=A0AAW0U550_SCYPA